MTRLLRLAAPALGAVLVLASILPAAAQPSAVHTISGNATAASGDVIDIPVPFSVVGNTVPVPPLPQIDINGVAHFVTCITMDTYGNEGDLSHILDIAAFHPIALVTTYVFVYDGTPVGNLDEIKVDTTPQGGNCGSDVITWAYGLGQPVSAGDIVVTP